MNELCDVELDTITSLLKEVFGAHVRVVACQVANHQPDYGVFLARLKRPDLRVVVKLAGPAAQMAGAFERTAAVYRLVKQGTTLPMPEVIAVDASMRDWPWRYLILTCLPGVEWRFLRERLDSEALALAQREIGAAVAELHCIEFPAFGQIDGSGQVQQPETTALAALRWHAGRIIAGGRSREAFLAALETRAACFELVQRAGLCHEDLHHGNLLFARQAGQWRLSAILDFDKAWAGPPESDLARLEFWRGMTSPDFWAAYRALRAVEQGYPERRPLYQLLWCLEYAETTPQHLNDTRRVCQELGIPAIENFD
ncbi:MAG: aminoglycoside phosphotransferase family protein [Chloroflexota bacterium]